ncbi:MAG: hypothetical protein AAGI01_14100, partial [Myxococcota bacterium]
QRERARAARTSRVRKLGMTAAPLAASAALLFVLPAFTIAPATSTQLPIVEQTIDWHKRGFPLEVKTADPVRVAQWFHGKVDFPVRLPQFKDRNVSLLGARLANIEDQRAAYVEYDVEGTKMSVMMFPARGLEVPRDRIQSVEGRDVALMGASGYGVAVLSDDHLTYTVTSALSDHDFMQVMRASFAP